MALDISAQKIQYSSENVFVENPNRVILSPKINRSYHLVTLTDNQRPLIFIFNQNLELKNRVKLPLKFPEKSQAQFVYLDRYYYIILLTHYNSKYLMWRIDEEGNLTDMSVPFQKFINPLFQRKSSFQMVSHDNELFMTFYSNVEANTRVTNIVQFDSLMNAVHINKIKFDHRISDGVIYKEMLVRGNLLMLKSARRGSALVLMKINLKTGDIQSYTYSSTFSYQQPTFSYNTADSTISLYSILREPGRSVNPKRFVFLSRLNKELVEETPFTILRAQFANNTFTNFLLVTGYQWNTFNPPRNVTTASVLYEPYRPVENYRDTLQPAPYYIRPVRQISNPQYDGSREVIRFSMVDNAFKKISDTVFTNSKNAFSLQANNSASFISHNKNYMVIGQQFFKKSNGLLLVSDTGDKLEFTDIMVNSRNDYLLSESKPVPGGIIIPYRHKREAGLIKITLP